jgi:autotransporter-associated beta strand protein
MLFGTAYGTSTGKLTLSGPINLNGIDQEFYVFNGATASGSIAEISSVITGSTLAGALSKTGPGTLRLTNKNTYIGLTAVGEGVLESTYIGLQYGSGSSTVGASILVGAATTYRYIGSGSQTYATLDLSYGSNTFKFDGAAGAYFPTMSLGANTVLTGTANQNAICEVDVITGDYPLALSGSNSWKISGLHASRTAATTALSGSKLILSTDHVGSGFVLGTGVTTIKAGATLETATGEIQSGKAKYNGNLILGTAGSGAVKAKYKIGNGGVKDTASTKINGNLIFTAPTNLNLNNSTIFNSAGEYIIFKYTGTCTGFEYLNPTTNIAGRYVSHMRHDSTLKRIYVTLS